VAIEATGRQNLIMAGILTEVNYHADSTPRRFELTVHLPAGLSSNQIERLTRVADTCPVRRALEAGFTFDEHVATDGPAPVRPTTQAA